MRITWTTRNIDWICPYYVVFCWVLFFIGVIIFFALWRIKKIDMETKIKGAAIILVALLIIGNIPLIINPNLIILSDIACGQSWCWNVTSGEITWRFSDETFHFQFVSVLVPIIIVSVIVIILSVVMYKRSKERHVCNRCNKDISAIEAHAYNKEILCGKCNWKQWEINNPPKNRTEAFFRTWKGLAVVLGGFLGFIFLVPIIIVLILRGLGLG